MSKKLMKGGELHKNSAQDFALNLKNKPRIMEEPPKKQSMPSATIG